MKAFPKISLCIQDAVSLEQDLKDTIHLCQNFGESLQLLISEKAALDSDRLNQVLEKLSPGDLKIEAHYLKGEAGKAILEFNQKQKFDLLIVPALAREGLIRYYTGSIARQLVQWGNCSILLIKPSDRSRAKRYQNLVCNLNDHPKSAHTLFIANEIAGGLSLTPWHISIHSDEEGQFDYFNPIVAKVELIHENVNVQKLGPRTGYNLSQSALRQKADLLLINAPDTKLGYSGRLIGDELEYLFSELPSDLMLVHSFDDPKFR